MNYDFFFHVDETAVKYDKIERLVLQLRFPIQLKVFVIESCVYSCVRFRGYQSIKMSKFIMSIRLVTWHVGINLIQNQSKYFTSPAITETIVSLSARTNSVRFSCLFTLNKLPAKLKKNRFTYTHNYSMY